MVRFLWGGPRIDHVPMKWVLVDPSGEADSVALETNVADLMRCGVGFTRLEYPTSAGPRLRGPGIRARAELLAEALHAHDVIIAARGGYGMSDLLDRLDWDALAQCAPRLVVGFSDISALHSALYARLGWSTLHAPMPGSGLWRKGGEDVRRLLELLRCWPGDCAGELPIIGCEESLRVSGRLFGGCFSVLGSLIGTGHFPATLERHILFLEDVNETVPRLLRGLNQWQQSGALERVSALVLGRFTHADARELALLEEWPAMVRERVACPVFASPAFGHVTPNLPLMVGAEAVIANGTLTWSRSGGLLLA